MLFEPVATTTNDVLMKKVIRSRTKKLNGIWGWQEHLRRSAAAPLAPLVQNNGGRAGESGLNGGSEGRLCSSSRGDDAESFQVSCKCQKCQRDCQSVKNANFLKYSAGGGGDGPSLEYERERGGKPGGPLLLIDGL